MPLPRSFFPYTTKGLIGLVGRHTSSRLRPDTLPAYGTETLMAVMGRRRAVARSGSSANPDSPPLRPARPAPQPLACLRLVYGGRHRTRTCDLLHVKRLEGADSARPYRSRSGNRSQCPVVLTDSGGETAPNPDTTPDTPLREVSPVVTTQQAE